MREAKTAAIATHPQRIKRFIGLFLAGMALLNALIFCSAWKQVVKGLPDYSIFYTAGLTMRRGQGHVLYDNSTQWQLQREFVSVANQRDAPLPYNHPAFEVLLFVPLTYLSYVSSYELWVAFNLLLLCGILLFLRARIPELQFLSPWLVLLAALAFFPIAYALMQGQDSILLLALYCLAYAALRRGREFQAGVWLGLGLFKFHLVLPFVLILLFRRRLRAVLGVALSAVVEILISWALVGWNELIYYPRYAWESNRHSLIGAMAPRNMANLRGLITGWNRVPSASPWPNIVLLAASVGLLIWAARQWDASDLSNATRWNNGFSVAMLATFLVSYHSYNQDMSILFLPILILSASVLQTHAETSYVFALKIVLGIMFFSPTFLILSFYLKQTYLIALLLLVLTAILAA
jgi:hypothetical protein